MEAMSRLIEQGKVRAAGVSHYSVAQLQEAERILPLASSQFPYNLVRRNIGADVVPYCIEHNRAILT